MCVLRHLVLQTNGVPYTPFDPEEDTPPRLLCSQIYGKSFEEVS